jgi:hypothetical protein
MRRTTSVAALLVLALTVASSHAADKVEKRDPGMRWFTDIDVAIEEAKARNIPLYVALHKDH